MTLSHGNRPRVIAWFSRGAASAVATKLILKKHPSAIPVYCDTGSEHPDSNRFQIECEQWFNTSVTSIKSDDYSSTWDVWEKTRWLAGIHGARCTIELKVGPRLEYQRPTDIHVFGYTSDKLDVKRAEKFRRNYPELTILTPLIDEGLTKAATLALIERAGIALPIMYLLGFNNNNCIPCVKATSPDYWALVRQEFPVEFYRIASLSRTLGVRLCRIKGERKFINEIPADWPTTNPLVPSCDFLCHLAEMEPAE